jgi:hypothetical protein
MAKLILYLMVASLATVGIILALGIFILKVFEFVWRKRRDVSNETSEHVLVEEAADLAAFGSHKKLYLMHPYHGALESEVTWDEQVSPYGGTIFYYFLPSVIEWSRSDRVGEVAELKRHVSLLEQKVDDLTRRLEEAKSYEKEHSLGLVSLGYWGLEQRQLEKRLRERKYGRN